MWRDKVVLECPTYILSTLWHGLQVVEKLDLIGLDYLWEVCLKTSDLEIAELAISLLMTMSYTNLSPKLKKVWHSHIINSNIMKPVH